MVGPVPGLRPSSLGGYSLGMPGPVPGTGGPSPRPSLGILSPELCDFIVTVVIVACWMGRGGAFGGVAGAMAGLFDAFYARHQERAAVLVEV